MCECSVWQFPVSCACVSCAGAVLWFENISGVTPTYLCMMTFLHGPFAAVGRHWVLALLGAAKSAGGARERATESVRRFEATLGRFGMPALLASGRDVQLSRGFGPGFDGPRAKISPSACRAPIFSYLRLSRQDNKARQKHTRSQAHSTCTRTFLGHFYHAVEACNL